MKLSALHKRHPVHACIFGPPKSGKSLLTGRLAEHGFNLKWLDIENGSTTLLYNLPLPAQERIELYKIPDNRYLPVAAETIVRLMKDEKGRICHEHGKIGCAICLQKKPTEFTMLDLTTMQDDDILVLDSWTQFMESTMAHICRNQKDEFFKPGWDEYNAQKLIHHSVLSRIQTAPFHVIVITHEGGVKMEDGKEKLAPVGGTENFSRSMAKYFDEVVYCEIKNKKHVAASSSTYSSNLVVGSRTNVELEKESEVSLVKMFRKGVEGKKDSAGSEAAKHLGVVAGQIANKS